MKAVIDIKTGYVFEIMHQQPGNATLLNQYFMESPPPFYGEGTSISVNDVCYSVMSTLVIIEESRHVGLETFVIITHQVRVK